MTKMKEPESMEECEFFSRRSLEEGHKVILWVPKDAPTTLNITYTCAKCKHEDTVTTMYKLPYTFECANCDLKIKVKPLKGKRRGIK